MIKIKILPIILGFIFSLFININIGFANNYDWKDSLLYNALDSSNSISNFTDGDESTQVTGTVKTIIYTLDSPTTIKGYQLKMDEMYRVRVFVDILDTNGNVIFTDEYVSSVEQYGTKSLTNLNLENAQSVRFRAERTSSIFVPRFRALEMGVFGDIDRSSPLEISSVTETHSDNTVTLMWKNPDDIDFSHVNLYKDSIFEDSTTLERYDFTSLSPETTYIFKITTEDKNSNESTGISIPVTTSPLPEPEEVTNVTVETKPERVNLSWKLPDTVLFQHVNIYRKDISVSQSTASKVNELLFGSKVYAAEYDPVFETNGTYFNDLTVQPNSEYEYKLTTQNETLGESDGVYISAVTPPEPKINFSTVAMPFGVNSLIVTIFSMIGLFGQIVLLSLTVVFYKPILRLIRKTVRDYKEGKFK